MFIKLKKRSWIGKCLIISIIAIALVISIEVVLRNIWGFCDAPLCIESSSYEYIFAPNQDRCRFGHHIHYNSYSQRSDEPDSTKRKFLALGDSFLNGGVLTSNEDLATSIYTMEKDIQMLNVSAGSWGPDNLAAYINEKGLFDASGMVVVLSSHDAHDVMDFEPVVGQSEAFPAKQYKSAIIELVNRYLVPRVKSMLKTKNKAMFQRCVAKSQ